MSRRGEGSSSSRYDPNSSRRHRRDSQASRPVAATADPRPTSPRFAPNTGALHTLPTEPSRGRGYSDSTQGTPAYTDSNLLSSFDELQLEEYTHEAPVFPDPRVDSRVQYAPQRPQVITDPELHQQGHAARARVYNGNASNRTLDHRFMVQDKPKRFFVPGKVIKVLWPELAGNMNDKLTSVTTRSAKFQDVRIFEKIRWFIVVKTGHGACTCLPIATYEGRGVGKPGVAKWQHCMVYTGKDPPNELPSESPGPSERAMLRPIRIRPNTRGDAMEPTSRLNFGKMYTVEHNVRVYDYGMVHEDFIGILKEQWNAVMGWTLALGHAQASTDSAHAESSSSAMASPATAERPASYMPQYVDYGEANADFTPPEGDTRQLALRREDRLAVLEWPYDGWARAYNQRSRSSGLVAMQYISLFETATVVYAFAAGSNASYISLSVGDTLKVIDYPYEGWVTVWNMNTAETGLVPENYIDIQSSD